MLVPQAQAQQTPTILFVPPQTVQVTPVLSITQNPPGITFSCPGGPPLATSLPPGAGNCVYQYVGPPAGLICDIPTILEIPTVGSSVGYSSQAFQCRAPEASPTAPLPASPIAPAPRDSGEASPPQQPTVGAPTTQDSEQQGESGEIDQTFDVS
jgi:hypothetical protein